VVKLVVCWFGFFTKDLFFVKNGIFNITVRGLYLVYIFLNAGSKFNWKVINIAIGFYLLNIKPANPLQVDFKPIG
tara:strand:+ start:3492 stop:3716 length:225 start_codon:yes stop_codon:yes gene_type:complete